MEVIEPEIIQAEPGQWKQISQEVSRLLDYQPGRFFWRETIRPEYVWLGHKQLPPVMAPAPVRVADGTFGRAGFAGASVGKQVRRSPSVLPAADIFWQRHGVFIARQQMVIWTRHCVLLLEAIGLCVKKEVASGYVQVGGTLVRYLDGENRGRCSQGYLWTALVPGNALSMNGTRAGLRLVWNRSWAKTMKEKSSTTVTALIQLLQRRMK